MRGSNWRSITSVALTLNHTISQLKLNWSIFPVDTLFVAAREFPAARAHRRRETPARVWHRSLGGEDRRGDLGQSAYRPSTHRIIVTQ